MYPKEASGNIISSKESKTSKEMVEDDYKNSSNNTYMMHSHSGLWRICIIFVEGKLRCV